MGSGLKLYTVLAILVLGVLANPIPTQLDEATTEETDVKPRVLSWFDGLINYDNDYYDYNFKPPPKKTKPSPNPASSKSPPSEAPTPTPTTDLPSQVIFHGKNETIGEPNDIIEELRKEYKNNPDETIFEDDGTMRDAETSTMSQVFFLPSRMSIGTLTLMLIIKMFVSN